MKALLKTGEWIVIDTTHVFHDQYNTVDGKRIFDHDISRIVDDVRGGSGRCKYCGATVRRGEEEKHFAEMESKPCAGCFWLRERVVDRQISKSVQINGNERTIIKTTVEKLGEVCSYRNSYSETTCANREHRRMGVDWFTPENTFFLRYPDGFRSIPEVDKLQTRGFVSDGRRRNAVYHKKLGSYTLEAVLSHADGKATGISYYCIWNSRRRYNFRYETGALYCDKYAMGWREVKTLEGVPASVMKAVKAICSHDAT